MSEAEILTIRNDLTAIVLSVVSVSFAMVSAYVAGLWLVLRRAPFALRLVAFMTLTFGLVFMAGLTVGLNDLLLGTERAWAALPSNSIGIAGFGSERPDWLSGFSLYEAAAGLGAIAFGLLYLALMYLTFFYRWPQRFDA
jgi:hypothetical protein